jgi:hypothetical protein
MRVAERELPTTGTVIGRTADGRIARIGLTDRLRHVWTVGQTGTGKSTLLANMILEDLEEGHGVAVLDPHGELVTEIRTRLPSGRRGDLEWVDASDPRSQPALNLLECGDVATAHARAGEVLELITALWPREMSGPMFQQACTNALLVLASRFEDPGTLADLPRLFTDDGFRREWLSAPHVTRVPEAIAWWKGSFEKQTASTRSEVLDYYISKFSMFAVDPVLRSVLGRPRSTLNLRQLMDERGVLLCSFARGCGVNPLATTLLIGVFMQSALNAALSRAELPRRERSPFFVYCDEFQRIAGPSTGSMLSEVRKYALGLERIP